MEQSLVLEMRISPIVAYDNTFSCVIEVLDKGAFETRKIFRFCPAPNYSNFIALERDGGSTSVYRPFISAEAARAWGEQVINNIAKIYEAHCNPKACTVTITPDGEISTGRSNPEGETSCCKP